jgi:hypothetical protein
MPYVSCDFTVFAELRAPFALVSSVIVTGTHAAQGEV